MAAAEIREEATAVNVKRINKIERTTIVITIKRITTIILTAGDTIIEGVALSNVAENQVKTEVTAATTGALTIFTDAGNLQIFFFFNFRLMYVTFNI